MTTKRYLTFLALALACVLGAYPAEAQTAPSLVSFQGRLTDSLNNPLAGSYNFSFAIFAAQTGGAPLWSETQNGITVANGVLTAELGSGTPIPESVFSSAQRYLEITVNGTTLAPRQRLLSVPYAMNAQTLGGKGYSALVSTDAAQVISGAKTFTADISMSGTARITNLAAPAGASDAATKAYVDNVAASSQNSALYSTQTFTGQNTFRNQVTVSSDIYVSAGRINLQGNLVTTAAGFLDASKLANTVPNSSLDASSVTKRGNTFNGPGQLVLLDVSGKLPAVDGSQITNVSAGNVSAAGVQPGTFVSGVLLPAAQVQAGTMGSGVIVSSLAAGAVYPGSLQSGIYNINITGNAGTVSNGVYTTAFYNDPSWLTGLATAKIDLSTVTAALAAKADTGALTSGLSGKLSNTETVPSSLIDLSTVTAALALRATTSALTVGLAAKLSNMAAVPSSLVDLSTVTAELASKASTASLTAGLAGRLPTTATVPASLIDLSTVTAELAGKLSNNAAVPPSLIDLSTVTLALAEKLSNSASIPPALVNLSTVTTALALKATSSALTVGLAGKLSNTAAVPAALINLSTVTMALDGKLDTAGDGSALTGITAAQVGLGNVSNVAQLPASSLDTDAALAANSDAKVASQKAAKAYVDAGLSAKADTTAMTAGLAGKLSSTAAVPPALINLSTVTSALNGKLPNTATVPVALINLSTVTAALAGKLDISGSGASLTGITAAQVGLGNVANVAQLPASSLDTDAALAANSDAKVASQKAAKAYIDAGLSAKADAGALTSGLAGKLSNTATIPPALVDLSTITAALSVLAGGADLQAYKTTVQASTAGIVNSLNNVAASTAPLVNYVNWNTAYGWGSHSAAGYAKLNSAQTFTGNNTFSSAANFSTQQGTLPGVYVSSGLIVADGYVGIGTANPQAKLDVNGGIKLGSTETAVPGTLRYNGSFEGYNGGGWVALNGSYTTDTSSLWSGSGDNVYTAVSSNVAVGSTNAGTNKFRVTGATSDSSANAALIENSDAASLFAVRNDGNVGVGKIPSERLDVAGTIRSDYGVNAATMTLSDSGANALTVAGGIKAGGVNIIGTDGKIPALSSVYFADLSRITSIESSTAPLANAANWNTAYSWGNHATAGYITSGNLNALAASTGTIDADLQAYKTTSQAATAGNSSAIAAVGATISTAVFTNGTYSDPAWISSLGTSKLNLSTVTAALNGKLDNTATVPQGLINLSTVTQALALKADSASVLTYNATVPQNLINLSTVTEALALKADNSAVSSALAGKANYEDVRTDTTTIAGNMAAGLAAKAGLAGVNTYSSSQTITDARGIYANRHMLSEGVEISSEASAAYGAGIRISSNVYIVGVSSASRYYGDGSKLTGIVATAKWVGYSATALNGNRNGYASANAECSAAYAGAHVCTNSEIMFTINSGLLGSNFPLNVSLWINNGPPGNTMNVNDCNGWVSSGGTEYGALWNRVAPGDGFGSIQPCSATAKFACCK